MNQIRSIIKYNHLSPLKNNTTKHQFILSKNKTSPLNFIEITPNQYRFVFDSLNDETKNILYSINEESKKNKQIDIQNLVWCGGGITVIYNYHRTEITSFVSD